MITDQDIVLGNIHSHNTMAANFSSVDIDTLKELAPEENFYISTVWATNVKSFEGSMSYLDQYDQPNLLSLKYVNDVEAEADDEWIEQAGWIIADKAAKAALIPQTKQLNAFNNSSHDISSAKLASNYIQRQAEIDRAFALKDAVNNTGEWWCTSDEYDYLNQLQLAYMRGETTSQEYVKELIDYGYEIGDTIYTEEGKRLII